METTLTVNPLEQEIRRIHQERMEEAKATKKLDMPDYINSLKEAGFSHAAPVHVAKHNETVIERKKTIRDIIAAHPSQFFLSPDDMEKVCKKYNLCIGELKYYRGHVPKLQAQQVAAYVKKNSEATMEIVAPLELFDVKKALKEKEDYQPVPRNVDPVVVETVRQKNEIIGYLVVAIWGPEAEIPELNYVN